MFLLRISLVEQAPPGWICIRICLSLITVITIIIIIIIITAIIYIHIYIYIYTHIHTQTYTHVYIHSAPVHQPDGAGAARRLHVSYGAGDAVKLGPAPRGEELGQLAPPINNDNDNDNNDNEHNNTTND